MGELPKAPEDYQQRIYRRGMQRSGLIGYRVAWRETDLHIQTTVNRSRMVEGLIRRHREPIERYINDFPAFATAMTPWSSPEPAPAIVGRMIEASCLVGVGPMAAVAGVIAEAVGQELVALDPEVIIENGGDIFFRCRTAMTIGLFAGNSPLSGKIGWRIDARDPLALCTSSATVGHSISYGRADAAAVLSENGALADAAATAIGNDVHGPEDIQPAIDKARSVPGIRGILVIAGESMGAWGEVDIVSLAGKNG